jgi:hypothetical protein
VRQDGEALHPAAADNWLTRASTCSTEAVGPGDDLQVG